MKLRGYVWSILGLAGFILLWQLFTKSSGGVLGYFCGTLVLLATGLELVRVELVELRRTITAQDKS